MSGCGCAATHERLTGAIGIPELMLPNGGGIFKVSLHALGCGCAATHERPAGAIGIPELMPPNGGGIFKVNFHAPGCECATTHERPAGAFGIPELMPPNGDGIFKETEKRRNGMMISGKAKVCGLMGCPVEHSLSPLMHNFFAQEMGIDFAYVPFRVEKNQVESAVKGAYALNLAGMNVTVPHKQQVIPYMKELDTAAKTIGAVNTLVRVNDGYKGYNTDALGLLRAIKDADMAIEGKDWLLIGAGGAAKAAAFVLGSEGASSVTVLNRSVDKAEALAREMNRHFRRDFMSATALKDYKKLPDREWQAVQTTSVGMHPHGHEAPVEDEAFYRNIRSAIDVIYTPAKTRFVDLVEQAGGRAVNGLNMLIYQGVEAFELWNPDRKVPEEVIEKARQLIREALEGQNG